MGTDILTVVADAYRTRGPLQQQVAARSFLSLMPQHEVEEQLGRLLDSRTLVPGSPGTVVLARPVRVSVLTRPVLAAWIREALSSPPELRDVLVTGIRAELRDLVRHCLGAPESTGLPRRGVEFAAVLAMTDLDLHAMDVVGGLPGTTRSQLQDLAAIPEGSCRSLKELQARMRRFVTTTFLEDITASG